MSDNRYSKKNSDFCPEEPVGKRSSKRVGVYVGSNSLTKKIFFFLVEILCRTVAALKSLEAALSALSHFGMSP